MIAKQICIRKCINGCLVSKGRHYGVGKNTEEWSEDEIRIEQLASKLRYEGKLNSTKLEKGSL